MGKNVMNNVKEKLAGVRKNVPGFSADMYLLTDYIASNINDEVVPLGMMVRIACVSDDLEKGRNGFCGKNEMPEEIKRRRKNIQYQIRWFPQVIDEIADEEFAEEFRMHWKECFKTVPPKRLNTYKIQPKKEYPAYVKIAVDWWANAIISPNFDNGEALPMELAFLISGSTKEYTEEEIKIFKETLSEEIMEAFEKYPRIDLEVDYEPCFILAKAGEKIGIPDFMGYPCKTYMQITPERVAVSAGYAAPLQELWKA